VSVAKSIYTVIIHKVVIKFSVKVGFNNIMEHLIKQFQYLSMTLLPCFHLVSFRGDGEGDRFLCRVPKRR